MPEENKPKKVKVITMGDEDTGKSCLIKRFCEKRFVSKYLPTIGIDYGVFRTKVGNKELRVDIFDMSGNPAFYDIRNEFYKDTNGAILIFDVTKRRTFENLMVWIRELHSEIKEANSSLPPVLILCANKVDKAPRSVSYYEVSKWAAIHHYPYFETSAFTGHGVTETFNALFESIINPEIYQSYMPSHVSFHKSPQYNTYDEMNSMPQRTTTMNTSNVDQSYNAKSKLKTSTKQTDMPSSPASSSSRFSKNASLKFTYQDLFEINRIKNAKNNYERLGVNITASSEEIRKAFRRLASILHPDKNNAPGSEEAFKILVKAKDALLSLSGGSNWFSSRFSS
ncbi:DnaJ likeubfamily C member 27 [Schistosoma japonicum]|nr:DnaJ likeubfamily C member 27 [Schistosoma japonicum]